MKKAVLSSAIGALSFYLLFSFANAGQWSKYASCDAQYERDIAICRKVGKQACWASAAERLAYCNRTKGKTGTPQLITK